MSRWRTAVDRALEASVVGSFTRIGHIVRRRTDRWDDDATAGRGRHVLVTGGNSGIGFATAAELLVRGAHVTVTTRDRVRGEQARTALLDAAARGVSGADHRALADRLSVEHLDLERLASVRELADRLDGQEPIDVVVHNAGAMLAHRSLTEDGLERTWQIHAVAPFLLTMLLIPGLASRPDARVVWVSSGGMYTERLVVRRVDSPGGYRPTVAYARAKRAQVELVKELHRRIGRRTGIAFHAMHPGWVRTPGIARSLPTFSRLVGPLLRTPEQGADTIVHLALRARADDRDPPAAGGRFWADRRPRPTDRFARTVCEPSEREALWERLMTDAGITRPASPV